MRGNTHFNFQYYFLIVFDSKRLKLCRQDFYKKESLSFYYLKKLFIYDMAHENALEEDRNLRFLLEDVPEDRDEVDSVSKQVINFESGSVYLPKYFIDSENHAVRKGTRRLRMVSGLLDNFNSRV
jgi:hypothetical protein